MFFTQEDYIKIQQWLTKNSVKDTEFNEANIPFNGEEIITIVQGNQNKKVFLKDLIAQVFNLGISDFVNITDKYDAPNISLEEAIRLIPSRARKEGQVITFLDKEDHWHIYQFKGVLNQWNVLDQWKDLFDFNINNFIIDSILPDEEDLTKSLPDANGNSYLSLKDREYNPEDFSGLGRVILRKNIVEIEDPIYGKVKKNILYQGMFTQANTIYEIRYDFDLNGEEITIPEGCVLDFQGGSLSNGLINLANNTNVENSTFNDVYVSCIGKHINISGIKFNVKNQEKTILKIEESEDIHLNKLEFNTEKVHTDNNCGNISVVQSKYVSIQNCILNGGVSDGSGNIASYSLLIDISEFITINNVLVKDCPAEGIGIVGSKHVSVLNSKGENCGWSFIVTHKKHDPEKFCTHIIINGCACYNSGASGYSFNCSESVLSNSIAIDYKTNNGVAIGHPTDMVWNVIVSNCYFKANLGENAHKYTFGARTFSSGKITICNCQFEGDMFGGIGITGKDSDIIITNNTFSNITRFVHIHPYDLAVVNDNINVYANNNIINKCNTLILNELITSKIEFKNNTIKEVNCIYEANSVSKEVIFSNNVVYNIGIITNSSIYRVRHFVVNSNRFINVFEQGNNVFFEITSGTNVSNAPNIEIYDNVFDYYKKLIHIIYLRNGTLQENISGNISVYNNIINNLENPDSFDCIAISLTGNINMFINNNIIKNIGYSNKGTTENRPTKYLINANNGFQYFDTSLNKPIYWTGEKWVDANGADV